MNASQPTHNYTTRYWAMGVVLLLLTSLLAPLFSQGDAVAPAYQQNQLQNVTQTLSPESLQQLLAPIALYPDALIALILSASTVPADVVLASRYFAANGDPQNIPNQSWDSSVKSLSSYPQIITWMDQNLQWTTTLGEAFIAQQDDVMSTIQQLRLQAQIAGNLVDTSQQRIVKQDSIIRIVPAEPEYIYVPQYDPEVVYVQPYSQTIGPLITFGMGFVVGAWLNYDCDWHNRQICRGDWQPGWNNGRYQHNGSQGGNNNVNVVNINQSTAQPWHPRPMTSQQRVRQQQDFARISSNFPANAQRGAAAATSPLAKNGQINSQIPRPTRISFGSNGAPKNNPVASPMLPATTMPQSANSSGFQPTTPPKLLDQNGKPVGSLNANNPNQGVTKQSDNHAHSYQTPQASTPIVGQNGENESAATKHKASVKAHYDTLTPQTSSTSLTAPLPKFQSPHSPPANNPPPQQVFEVPKHHDLVSTPNAAPKLKSPPQQPPSVEPQVHKIAPPPQVTKAPPANSNQSQSPGSNPDKKKKDE